MPVYSGASRATLLDLATAVDVSLNIPAPDPGAPDGKSVGQAQSEGGIVSGDGVYGFRYTTSLRQLVEGFTAAGYEERASDAARAELERFDPPKVRLNSVHGR